jgi:uncharacterized protein with PIN domain
LGCQRGDKEIGLADLIQEQRSLTRSKNSFERVVGSLCIGAILKERLVGLPNSKISQLMTDHIWCQMNLLGPESAIVEIASERLVEKREASLVCPECGSEFWRADE